MKKAMKKLMAALLAVAMVCAMAIPAFADGSSSTSTAAVTLYTITAPKNGHTYEIYQIFTGDYDALQPSMLANIKWGKTALVRLAKLLSRLFWTHFPRLLPTQATVISLTLSINMSL